MARELQAWFPTGATLYAVLRDASGNPWNGSAFDATPTAGEWTSYDIALTEDSTIGFYAGTFPAAQTAGMYTYHVHRQAGGSPAATDPVIAVGGGDWTGSAWTAQSGDAYARIGAPAGASVSADVAAVKADTASILARLGAWTGSGINTVLGGIRALAAKAAALTPTDLSSGTTYDNTTDSLEALADGSAAAEVWSYATRTLTTPGATDADTTTVTAISRRRGDRWTIALTGMGDISTRTKLWFTLKGSDGDADTAAWVQVTEAGGLVAIYGGGSITAGNASITVDDAGDGDITIRVSGVETAKLPVRTAAFDVQVLRTGATGPDTIAEGDFTITADVTRATS